MAGTERDTDAAPIDAGEAGHIHVSLTGRDPSKWKRFRDNLATRLNNLYATVANLETFKRRSVIGEANRLAHAVVEAAHAKMEMPAMENAKLKADIEAAVAKAELDRANARVANEEADIKELEKKRLRHDTANREIQRRIARGELEIVQYDGNLVIVATGKRKQDKDKDSEDS